MQTIIHTTLASLALLLSMPGLLSAAVTAQLERNTVYHGDTVILHITTTGEDQGAKPDLTPLQQDFDILGTSNSRQIQFINGQRSDKHEWLFELAPLRSGTLTLPALTVGKSTTTALTLRVNEQSQDSTSKASKTAFIRAEISPVKTDTYVQQQLLYSIRLYYRIPLIEGNFNDPKINAAVVERLGEDRQYKTTIDGQNYQVIERRYAIFPEHSGALNIGPVVFIGRTVSATSQPSSFSRMDSMMQRMLQQNGFSNGFFSGTPFGNPGKRIRLSSEAITLNIKPRPSDYKGAHWLPSQQLALHDSWATKAPVIRAGEPITRTLILETRGLEASQLPDISPAESTHLKIYPQPAELSNRTDGDWIYGRSEQQFTYVATRTGRIELPEIRIDWWDSINHKAQTSVLPAWEIIVEAGSTEPNETTENAITDAAFPAQSGDSTSTAQPIPSAWLLGGVLATLALLAAFLRRRRTATSNRPQTPSGSATKNALPQEPALDNMALKRTRQALRNACTRGDACAAASALLDWAAATWPQQPPRSLGALATRVDRGETAIRELDASLYGTADASWNGQALWQAFMSGLQKDSKPPPGTGHTDSAPPLYPDWSQKTG